MKPHISPYIYAWHKNYIQALLLSHCITHALIQYLVESVAPAFQKEGVL